MSKTIEIGFPDEDREEQWRHAERYARILDSMGHTAVRSLVNDVIELASELPPPRDIGDISRARRIQHNSWLRLKKALGKYGIEI